jgi:hypothetical protein
MTEQLLPSDHAFTAFLYGCDRRTVQLDYAAHASAIELRMLASTPAVGDQSRHARA